MKIKSFGLDMLNIGYFLDIQDKMARKLNIRIQITAERSGMKKKTFVNHHYTDNVQCWRLYEATTERIGRMVP